MIDPSRNAFTANEVAAIAQITPRALRHWSTLGVFEPPPFRGPATRYTRAHVEQVIAIAKLRRDGVKLEVIKERLAAEVAEKRARAAVEAEAAAKAKASEGAATGSAKSEAVTATYPAERWERVVLIPGLELLVNTAGGGILRRLAAEIYAQYGAGSAISEAAEAGDSVTTR
jgi:DNA-binding transcriptional MerR regulator